MVPLPRHASVGGIPITDLLSGDRIKALIERTRKGGEEILSLAKVSSAYYPPAAAVAHMVEAIVRDKKRVMPCVAYLQGEYGIEGLFMSVPVIIGATGVERVLGLKVNAMELAAIRQSADAVKRLVPQLSH